MSETAGPALVPGRSCDGCTMCCKLMGIGELQKPRHKWCPHCAIGQGCKIYESRPGECRAFYCGWLTDPGVGEHWAPKRSRMVLTYRAEESQLTVHVDSDRSSAWREAPFRADIARWAELSQARGGQMLIRMAKETVAILPDHEKSLGAVRDDQVILTIKREEAGRVSWDALAVERDDPILKKAGK